jgi:hypothetical protein
MHLREIAPGRCLRRHATSGGTARDHVIDLSVEVTHTFSYGDLYQRRRDYALWE